VAINATIYDYQLYHGRDLEGVLEGGWTQRPEKHFVLLCEASAPAPVRAFAAHVQPGMPLSWQPVEYDEIQGYLLDTIRPVPASLLSDPEFAEALRTSSHMISSGDELVRAVAKTLGRQITGIDPQAKVSNTAGGPVAITTSLAAGTPGQAPAAPKTAPSGGQHSGINLGALQTILNGKGQRPAAPRLPQVLNTPTSGTRNPKPASPITGGVPSTGTAPNASPGQAGSSGPSSPADQARRPRRSKGGDRINKWI